MPNPLRMLRDYSRKRQVAHALYETLKRKGRPGGIDVSKQDPEFAAAIMHLVSTRPHEVTVVKNKARLTLMFTEDVHRTFTPAMAEVFDRNGITAKPGEDLLDE